jgi:hypothetical protein
MQPAKYLACKKDTKIKTLKLPLANFFLLKNSVFKTLCQEIIKVDTSIRSAGITNEDGIILHISHRKGIKPLLSSEERAQYAITAATRQFTRLRWEVLLGKIQYASSHYSKLIRATIPVTDDNRKLSFVIILSLDAGTDNFHEIIVEKIIPLIKKRRSGLKS